MANKRTSGLPPGFDLNIPRPDAPVRLGDYLDEVEASPPAPRPVPPLRPEPTNVIELPRAREPEPEAAPPPAEEVSDRPEAAAPRRRRERAAAPAGAVATRRRRKERKGPARKQINASPEALKMIDELIEHVQTYSVQKDAKASEVFHALVLSLYEAREHLDLSDVPARGRWGTPTAKAFPVLLKNAFQSAIAAAYRKNRR